MLIVAEYANNPGGAPTFQSGGHYYDIYLSDDTGVASVTIYFCEDVTPEMVIYYWDASSSSWEACSDQYYSDGCIVVTITDSTTPSLSDLTELPFASGTPYPPPTPIPPTVRPGGEAVGIDVYSVNKIGLLAPWLTLALIILAGSIFLVRRRVHS
jgi:hypothetical protein